MLLLVCDSFFFFNDTATTEIYTLSLHDALPISAYTSVRVANTKSRTVVLAIPPSAIAPNRRHAGRSRKARDRKSTRLNSSHGYISYAVFCLKKKSRRAVHTLSYP